MAISKGVCRSIYGYVCAHDMYVFGRELGAERQVSPRNPTGAWSGCAQGNQVE